jgi:uroporphyrinogen-III synthase
MTIILTQAEPLTDKLVNLAKLHSHQLAGIPGIYRQLAPKPITLENISGIVITSQWGWRGLKASIPDITKLTTLPIICVGEATKARIEHDGFHVSHWVAHSGQLPERLHSSANGDQPAQWFWPCGNRPIDDWTDQLDSNVQIKQTQVYTTSLRKDFSPEEHNTLAKANILAVTSPSNIAGLYHANVPLPKIIVAIGKTTAKAVENYGLTVNTIAPKPSLTSLIEAGIKTVYAD